MDLKAFLTETKETQSEFAERVSTTPATISRLIAGAMRPGLDLAHVIEGATNGAVPTETWTRPVPVPDTPPPFPTPPPRTDDRHPSQPQANPAVASKDASAGTPGTASPHSPTKGQTSRGVSNGCGDSHRDGRVAA